MTNSAVFFSWPWGSKLSTSLEQQTLGIKTVFTWELLLLFCMWISYLLSGISVSVPFGAFFFWFVYFLPPSSSHRDLLVYFLMTKCLRMLSKGHVSWLPSRSPDLPWGIRWLQPCLYGVLYQCGILGTGDIWGQRDRKIYQNIMTIVVQSCG